MRLSLEVAVRVFLVHVPVDRTIPLVGPGPDETYSGEVNGLHDS
jgi:hypothetical protein